MLILSTLLACHFLGPDAAPCETSECRVQRVAELWESDPAGAVEALDGLTPEERVAAVSVVLLEHPDASSTLCEHLPAGSSADWCSGLARRPHLWTALPEQAQPSARRAAPGPASTSALPTRGLSSDLSRVVPGPEPCAGDDSPVACQTARASRRARRGKADMAATACLALPDPTWQQECFFVAAEAAAGSLQSGSYLAAAQLCGMAGEFQANCYWHTAMAPATAAPPADQHDPTRWRPVLAGESTILDAWAEVDPAYGEHLVGLLWGRATSEAMARAGTVDGTVVAVLPERAAPHIRAALAAELLRREGADTRDLAAWVSLIEARLKATSEQPGAPPGRDHLGVASKRDLWPVDRGDDGAVPAVLYLGGSRRALSSDVATDVAICVLEGAARLDPPARDLVRQGLAHPDPLVKWTAERLLAALDP